MASAQSRDNPRYDPTRGERDSIERGVSELLKHLPDDAEVMKKLRAMERRT